jgi:hypothetical protein
MTDFRDPNLRHTEDMMRRDPTAPRDPSLDPALRPWNDSTWAWIAGAAVVALVLMFIFTIGSEPTRTATNTASPPAENRPAPVLSAAPTMRPATPETTPAPAPAPENRQ